jgi:hypothetical protein
MLVTGVRSNFGKPIGETNLRRNHDVEMFGDFVVCPLTRPKTGEMQLVCIEAGKNLAVRRRK